MVPLTGLEPVRCCHRGILSPLRLPIPPQRQMLEAPSRFGLEMKVLQTSALPLGYGAITPCRDKKRLWSGRRDSDPRHLPWQGNALPLSHSRTTYSYLKVPTTRLISCLLKYNTKSLHFLQVFFYTFFNFF